LKALEVVDIGKVQGFPLFAQDRGQREMGLRPIGTLSHDGLEKLPGSLCVTNGRMNRRCSERHVDVRGVPFEVFFGVSQGNRIAFVGYTHHEQPLDQTLLVATLGERCREVLLGARHVPCGSGQLTFACQLVGGGFRRDSLSLALLLRSSATTPRTGHREYRGQSQRPVRAPSRRRRPDDSAAAVAR
jgi:hypothetical protein